MKDRIKTIIEVLENRKEESINKSRKWEGTTTTYGDTDKLASDAEFGAAQAYEDAIDLLSKLAK